MAVIVLKSLLEVACTQKRRADTVLIHTLVSNVVLFHRNTVFLTVPLCNGIDGLLLRTDLFGPVCMN